MHLVLYESALKEGSLILKVLAGVGCHLGSVRGNGINFVCFEILHYSWVYSSELQ